MERIVGGAGPAAGDAGLPGQPLGQRQSCPAKAVSVFDCPVCYEYLCPPIYQCRAGHLVCSSCRPKISRCPSPSCRGQLGKNRNLALEKVASLLSFPCKYGIKGCGTFLPYMKRTSHEDVCEYRPYVCPLPNANCKWQGPLEEVEPHICLVHKCLKKDGKDIKQWYIDINHPIAVNWVALLSWFGHDFLIVLEKQKKNGMEQFYCFAQLLGSRKDAAKFTLKLELNGPEGRLLAWTGRTRSVRDQAKSVILSSDSFNFDKKTADFLYQVSPPHYSGGGALVLCVTILNTPV